MSRPIPRSCLHQTAALWARSALAVAPVLSCLALGWLQGDAIAGEIHSNGFGGGRWSEPATWRGGMVPTAEDDAVIAARDTVVFDRDDSVKPTCKQLILDPKSNLTFQGGLGKRTLTVDGPVEIYGAFKMTAQAAGDEMALQLSAAAAADRTVKVERGGALLVSGRPFAPGSQPNARLTVTAPPEGKVAASAEVTIANKGAIELQNAWIHQTIITVNGIDNTGAKPNERCNLLGNLFTAQATVSLAGCDSAVVARNTFEAREGARPKAAAIRATSCPLTEIRENQVNGPYWFGIELMTSECVVSGNRVRNCTTGISYTRSQMLLKSNRIHNCNIGIRTTLVSGISEELTLEQCPLPALVEASTLQLSGVRLVRPADKPDSNIRLADGSLQLINCDLQPTDISVVNTQPSKSGSETAVPAVQAMAMLVVKLTGAVPRNVKVALRTARPEVPPAAGALDLNVRNSPAPVRADGTTPLPSTLVPLIAKSWSLNSSGVAAESPGYILDVLGPPNDPGTPPVVLKSLPVKPESSWFRPSPNGPEPTLEVSLP